jgi:hypothetical protein
VRHRLLPICVLTIILLLTINASNAFGYSENYINENEVIFDDKPEPLMGPTWYTKPSNYAQLVSWYQALESAYPNYLEVFKANQLYGTGTVTGGYDLYYVRITNENLGLHKPEILFLGSPHGDETVGTIGMYWFTDWLMRMAFTDEPCQEYSKDYLRWLIDNREIYFAVSHNPYGFDHGPQRYDGNGWDLNREADMDGPGSPTGGIWASVNGKTLRAFVDNHLIRVACDFHGGARMLLYPWGSTHSSIIGVSPISGKSYTYAPPDFYFFDASSLRVGSYMGAYGGTLNQNNIGTIPPTVGYSVKGGISPWAYGADVTKNPVEDPWVVGDYPGAGILWLSPEMSNTKNPSESTFGNDTVHMFGAEVRRFILHQTDLAQPYILWQPGTIQDNSEILPETTVPLFWQVNGSLVVDHTYIQWGKDPDPINNPEYLTEDYDGHSGDYYGGTGWDNANSGQTQGVTYNENIYLTEPGDYYFVAKAQVDQIYSNVLRPDVYKDNPYLRLVKERTNDSYYEELEGTDGTEIVSGQTWWYSPIIHVRVLGGPPETPEKPSGPTRCKVGVEYTFTTSTTDPDDELVYYQWFWGGSNFSSWYGPYESGETASASHTWATKDKYNIRVRARDQYGQESDWSEPLSVNVPRSRISAYLLLQSLLEKFNYIFTILLKIS